MKKKIFLLIINLTLLSMQTFPQNQVQIIPKPQEIKILNGDFSLSNNISVSSSGADIRLVNYLKDYLSELYGYEFDLTEGKRSGQSISLQIEKDFLNTKPEAYSLKVDRDGITIISSSEAGLFYGIQTLLQLLPKNISNNETIKIKYCEITDYPRFSWRGLNLDCCRHFMTKDFIKRYIDILAYYKFNVFHWHLTEDQGWRIEIKKYPKLTEIGAWRKEADGSVYGGYYSQEDIKEIVEYAQSRFISVVPEIEMPGHSLASLASYPENSCTGGPFEVTNMWGVMKDVYCAGRDSTFYFLQNILDEVTELFPGKYIHIGGDEVLKDRWRECSRCRARIDNEALEDENELQSYFIRRIAGYLAEKGKRIIGWDEILEGGLAPLAVVQSWQGFQGAVDAAKLRHRTICSPASHTYLNADPEDLDLRTAYSFEPVPGELSEGEKKFVIGSEANLWTEYAPQETVDSKLFPRILALAEVFWLEPGAKNYDDFYSRLKIAYNDMKALGIQYGRESRVIIPSSIYDEKNKEFVINLNRGQNDIDIRYTENGNEPDSNSILYNAPIRVKKSSKVKIAAFRNDHFIGKKITLAFDFHKALNSEIILKNNFSERYRGSGEKALVDGIRGTDNFKDGLWQGFEGVDFEAVIDLGEEKEISRVTPRFYLNSNSWIFLPLKVQISLSKDNISYSDEKVILNDIPQKNSEIILKDFRGDYNGQSARYIRIKGENIREVPEWHPGAGGKAWLFIDEIIVD